LDQNEKVALAAVDQAAKEVRQELHKTVTEAKAEVSRVPPPPCTPLRMRGGPSWSPHCLSVARSGPTITTTSPVSWLWSLWPVMMHVEQPIAWQLRQ
jgi:hypothetical protein